MKRSILLFFVLVAFSVVPSTTRADGLCDVARDVLAKAAAAFQDDQATGLKLFIKAHELCADDPVYAYNLGVAYYRYGRMAEAVEFLAKAVTAEGKKAPWRNNYAMALLDHGDVTEALAQAEKAFALESGDSNIAETLARVRARAGKKTEALQGLLGFAADHKWDKELKERYAVILDDVLAGALSEVNAGQVDRGLAVLAGLDFDAKATQTRILVLARVDRGDEALAAAFAGRDRFPGNQEIVATADEAANTIALGLYKQFRGGKQTEAVRAAKELSDRFPGVEPLLTAYNKLLAALLNDATAIEVPEAVARADTKAATGRADKLLAALDHGDKDAAAMDLKVDVDQNIPEGRQAGEYDVAVVIGNQDYQQDGVPDVDYAGRDAGIMREYLVKTMGFNPGNIIAVTDAKLGNFNQIFGTDNDFQGRLYNFVKPGVSRVFVYYVGHGAPDLTSGDAYFVPVEADPQYLHTSGYRLATFYKNLETLPALEITVVLDACFSGNSSQGLLFKGVSSIVVKPKAIASAAENAVVIASSRAEQVSTWYPEKRHSLFTYYFLKGLQGEADHNHDRKVSVGEMAAYLAEKVPYMARRLKGAEQQPTVSGSSERVLAWLK